jgi:hypothetical protein
VEMASVRVETFVRLLLLSPEGVGPTIDWSSLVLVMVGA